MTGIYFSPQTRLTRCRVVGLDPGSENFCRTALTSVQPIPAMQYPTERVESAFLRIPSIAHCSFSRNIFGRGLLKVQYRRPVAMFAGSNLGLDEDGTIFKSLNEAQSLPLINANENLLSAGMALLMPVDLQGLAELAVGLRKEIPDESIQILLRSSGSVTITIGQTKVIRWGDLDDSDKKFDKLTQLLKMNVNFWGSGGTLSLVDPEHPAFLAGSPKAVKKS